MHHGRNSTFWLWVLLILVIAAGAGSYFWMTGERDDKRGIMRFARRLTNSVDPAALQKWAMSVLEAGASDTNQTGQSAYKNIPLPSIVREIPTFGYGGPQVARASASPTNPAHIKLLYIGGFGGWGIEVGPTWFILEEGPRCHELISGVYVRSWP